MLRISRILYKGETNPKDHLLIGSYYPPPNLDDLKLGKAFEIESL